MKSNVTRISNSMHKGEIVIDQWQVNRRRPASLGVKLQVALE